MRQIACLLAFLLPISAASQDFQPLPESLGENAFQHVENLCDLGLRRHDLPSGKTTINYVKEQFEKNGLICTIDTFRFGGVEFKNRSILINGDSIRVQTILLNQTPKPKMILRGESRVLRENDPVGPDLHDQIVFTSQSNNTLLLKRFSPKAIVALLDEELERVQIMGGELAELVIKGNSIGQLSESYNVIGTYRNYDKSKKDILITAHWDSQAGPGADDNASGVSLVLELSDYFSEYQPEMPYNLKFIVTGAEEIGLIGSKAYVLNYTGDVVDNTLLNMNIDAVGGGRKPYIEMRHPVNFKNPDNSEWMEIITNPDSTNTWYTTFLEVYRNSSSEGIYPDWLVEEIESAMNKANINYYNASCCSGADHRSFAYLGIPVVYLGMTRKYEKKLHHTEEDTPKDYFKNSLEIAGKAAQSILVEICSNKK